MKSTTNNDKEAMDCDEEDQLPDLTPIEIESDEYYSNEEAQSIPTVSP